MWKSIAVTAPNLSPMSKDGHTENRQSSENPAEGNKSNAEQSKPEQGKENSWFKDLRGSLMTVAVLVASATYTTGLSPPGGLWQDDLSGHTAGSPILRDKAPDRYKTFYYANSTAFMTSLVIIILLTNEKVYEKKLRTVVLSICMVLDLVSMMIAFAAGSSRSIHTSVYVIALAVVALFVIFCCSLLLAYLCCCVPEEWQVCILGKEMAQTVPKPAEVLRTFKSVAIVVLLIDRMQKGKKALRRSESAPIARENDHPAVSQAAGLSHSVSISN